MWDEPLGLELKPAASPGQVIACFGVAQIHGCRLVHRRRGACHADADGGQVVFSAMRGVVAMTPLELAGKNHNSGRENRRAAARLWKAVQERCSSPFSGWSDRLGWRMHRLCEGHRSGERPTKKLGQLPEATVARAVFLTGARIDWSPLRQSCANAEAFRIARCRDTHRSTTARSIGHGTHETGLWTGFPSFNGTWAIKRRAVPTTVQTRARALARAVPFYLA